MKETSEINILIFNYLNETIVVDLDVTSDSKSSLIFKSCQTQFNISQNEIKQHTCNVTANKNGKFNITAKADAIYDNQTISDGEVKELYVTLEGYEVQVETPLLIDLSKINFTNGYVKHIFNYEEVVDKSLKVFVTVSPYLLSNEWKISAEKEIFKYKLEPNIKYVNGCCEQRFRDFFPMVFLINYLETVNKLTDDQRNEAKKVITEHVKELCYHKANDGSFVAYDYAYMRENTPFSLWQTANILKVLYYANKYAYVDSKIITDAIFWLRKAQQFDGKYDETNEGVLIKTTNINVYLTSFVYISLWLHHNTSQNFNHHLIYANEYLEDNFNVSCDLLDITISCYVFQLSKSYLKDECVDVMLNQSKVDNNGMRSFFRNENKELVAAYALMIFTERNSFSYGFETFKYLISAMKYNDIIVDSHVNGLCHEAMAKYIKHIPNTDGKQIIIDFAYNNNINSFVVLPNHGFTQALEIDNKTSEVNITATGYGIVMASVIWNYYIKSQNGNSFSIYYAVVKNGNRVLYLNVCNRYKYDETVYNIITEIDLPSGYAYLNYTTTSHQIDRIDVINDNSHINLYIKELSGNHSQCYTFGTIQTYKVTNIKPGSISTYIAYGDKNATHIRFIVEIDVKDKVGKTYHDLNK